MDPPEPCNVTEIVHSLNTRFIFSFHLWSHFVRTWECLLQILNQRKAPNKERSVKTRTAVHTKPVAFLKRRCKRTAVLGPVWNSICRRFADGRCSSTDILSFLFHRCVVQLMHAVGCKRFVSCRGGGCPVGRVL